MKVSCIMRLFFIVRLGMKNWYYLLACLFSLFINCDHLSVFSNYFLNLCLAGGESSIVRPWNLRPSVVWKDGQWMEWSRENNSSRHEV